MTGSATEGEPLVIIRVIAISSDQQHWKEWTALLVDTNRPRTQSWICDEPAEGRREYRDGYNNCSLDGRGITLGDFLAQARIRFSEELLPEPEPLQDSAPAPAAPPAATVAPPSPPVVVPPAATYRICTRYGNIGCYDDIAIGDIIAVVVPKSQPRYIMSMNMKAGKVRVLAPHVQPLPNQPADTDVILLFQTMTSGDLYLQIEFGILNPDGSQSGKRAWRCSIHEEILP